MRRLLSSLIAAGFMVAVISAAGQATGTKQTTAKPAAPAGMTKITWKCATPNPQNAIPVPDQPNHAFVIEQGQCTAQSDDVMGVKHKDGTFVEFVEGLGNTGTGRGVMTSNMANGDKIVYSYNFKGTNGPNGKMQSGTADWKVQSGTGKFKGVTGHGTCKSTGAADGSATHECSGTYAPPKM